MSILIYILGSIIFLECLNPDVFGINLGRSPFSLGQIIFLLLGFSHLRGAKSNSVIVSFVIVYTCIMVASFYNPNSQESLSRSLGSILLLVACIGWARVWSQTHFKTILDLFFIVSFFYWSQYVISVVLTDGVLQSYGSAYSKETDIVNHHICGLAISSSSIFLLGRYFIKQKSISMLGYPLIIFTITVLFLTESRSNTIVYFLMLLFIYQIVVKVRMEVLLTGTLLILITGFIFGEIGSQEERIKTRFTLDRDYQSVTNRTRMEIYKRTPAELLENPFGKGIISGSKIASNFQVNPHNQYLTFAYQGGIICLGCMGFVITKIVGLGINSSKGYWRDYFSNAVILFLLTYWITLLTIDQGGLFFYISLSLLFLMVDSSRHKKTIK